MTFIHQIGSGFLTFPHEEYLSKRYGTVYLLVGGRTIRDAPLDIEGLAGQKGSLLLSRANLKQITLGVGTFFSEMQNGYLCVGVAPDDHRPTHWLDMETLRFQLQDMGRSTLYFQKTE